MAVAYVDVERRKGEGSGQLTSKKIETHVPIHASGNVSNGEVDGTAAACSTHWSMMLMIGAAVAVVHLRPYDATHMSAATVTITHSMCYPSHKWHSHQQIKRLRCAST